MEPEDTMFKEYVSEYVELCDTLKPVKLKIKVMKKRMTELEQTIMGYMKKNTLHICRLQDQSCLKFCTSSKKATISKKQLQDVVLRVLNDDPLRLNSIQTELELLEKDKVDKDYLKRESS
jgi:Glu-tRNA(Gln) amidotransferase subunit E-like FAD-binding protein